MAAPWSSVERIGPRLLREPPEERPKAAERPCPACGRPVEPLRAGCVLLFEDGFRYLCDADCARRYRAGERARGAPATPRDEHTPLRAVPAVDETQGFTPQPEAPEATLVSHAHWLGFVLAGAAALLGLFAATPAAAVAAAVSACSAALVGLWLTWPSRRDIGTLAWVIGPAGAILAAGAAADAAIEGSGSWLGVEGAVLVAFAMVARGYFDARGRLPIVSALRKLTRELPRTAHMPVSDVAGPMGVAVREVRASRIRIGQEIVATEGDVLAVDGVIKAGQASALLHPGARTPMPRRPGDPVLAGARIVEGGIRVLATRVGDDRALCRLRRFGSRTGQDATGAGRFAGAAVRWGGPLTLAFGVAVYFSVHGGLTTPLAMAASVLVASPLLALRRGAELPVSAVAANAGVRGIVYQNARALDEAGRIHVAAISPHSTLTEGKPEVVEIHALDDMPVAHLIAMVAAAEAEAEDHPLAQAILRFAEARGIELESVRRATYLPGRGVTALTGEGEALVVGNRRLLLDEGVSVAVADAEAARDEARGRTVLFAALAGHVRAVISLQDAARPGARAAVQRMFDMGVEVVLLSGDQRGTVEALATALDIAHVKAELLPDERGTEVRRLGDTGGRVAAIGHPEKDDAALAAADVPVALGAAGGTSGDRAVALVTRDIGDAAAALWMARAAHDTSWRVAQLAMGCFVLVVATAWVGLMVPAVAAALALGTDAYACGSGTRLLQRIALRVPSDS